MRIFSPRRCSSTVARDGAAVAQALRTPDGERPRLEARALVEAQAVHDQALALAHTILLAPEGDHRVVGHLAPATRPGAPPGARPRMVQRTAIGRQMATPRPAGLTRGRAEWNVPSARTRRRELGGDGANAPADGRGRARRGHGRRGRGDACPGRARGASHGARRHAGGDRRGQPGLPGLRLRLRARELADPRQHRRRADGLPPGDRAGRRPGGAGPGRRAAGRL